MSAPALASTDMSIVLSDDSEHYHQVAQAFRQAVASRHPRLTMRLLRSAQLESTTLPATHLLVTIGTEAAVNALTHFSSNPRLNLFITSSTWRDLTAGASTPYQQAAILVDQPLERFIHLALLIKPDSRILATAFGDHSSRQRELFAALARQHKLSVADTLLHTRDNPITALTPLFSDADVFIAVPDRGLFNQSVARWALFLGYRHKVPVIGFSRAYAKAGALVSLQSDPFDIGRQGAAWLDRYLAWQKVQPTNQELFEPAKQSEQERLWRAFPPRDFSVALNPSVARALGITVGSEDWLHQQLTQRLSADLNHDASQP
ncbi:MAG: hypothetical protein M0Q49_00315 [Porticoccaceae bacterium]|nr:hypothetical protein [Porticoccaceae bacterium]